MRSKVMRETEIGMQQEKRKPEIIIPGMQI